MKQFSATPTEALLVRARQADVCERLGVRIASRASRPAGAVALRGRLGRGRGTGSAVGRAAGGRGAVAAGVGLSALRSFSARRARHAPQSKRSRLPAASPSKSSWDPEALELFRRVAVSPPRWYELLNILLILASIGVFAAETWLRGAGDQMDRVLRPALLRADVALWLYFFAEYALRCIAQKTWAARVSWACSRRSLIDLVALLAFSSRVPYPFVCFRALRLIRHVWLWRKRARYLREDNAAKAVVLTAAVLSVLLQLGTTLTVTAALLWEIEGVTRLNPELANLGDAYYYMLCIFAGEGAPFPVVSGRGKAATALAILLGLCTVPFAVAELVKALGISVSGGGGAGTGWQLEREFWALQLQRVDRLEREGLLTFDNARGLRALVSRRSRSLAITFEAFGDHGEEREAMERLATRLCETMQEITGPRDWAARLMGRG